VCKTYRSGLLSLLSNQQLNNHLQVLLLLLNRCLEGFEVLTDKGCFGGVVFEGFCSGLKRRMKSPSMQVRDVRRQVSVKSERSKANETSSRGRRPQSSRGKKGRLPKAHLGNKVTRSDVYYDVLKIGEFSGDVEGGGEGDEDGLSWTKGREGKERKVSSSFFLLFPPSLDGAY